MGAITSDTPTSRTIAGYVIHSIMINIISILPLLMYSLLSSYMSTLAALLLAAILPLLDTIVRVVRRQHLNVFALLVLIGIGLNIGLIVADGHDRLLLVRESLLTGLFGIGFTVSVFLERPLGFYLARHLSAGNNSAKRQEWERYWQYPVFRYGIRRVSMNWGTGLILEAVVRVFLAFTLPVTSFLLVSPFIQWGLYAMLTGWTIWYANEMQRYSARHLQYKPRTAMG